MSHRRLHLVRTLVVFAAVLVSGVVATAPAGAIGPVTDAAGLAEAWADPRATTIHLGADIELCPGVERNSDRPVTVHGHGHTVRATCPTDLFVQLGSGKVTFRNVTLRDIPTDETFDTGHAVRAQELELIDTQVLHTQGTGGAAVIADDVHVRDSRFEDNVMVGDFGDWGAISAANVVVRDSTFVDNSSRFGPSAIAAASLDVDGSHFERNFSNIGSSTLDASSDLTITDSVFITNGTSGAMGGVVHGQNVTIDSSTFTDADVGFGDGGFVGGSTVRVHDSTFTNGRSLDHGGAIAGGDVEVTRSTFEANTAGDGGAIAVTGSLRVDSTTFSGNTVDELFGTFSGGAIFQSGSGPVEITNSTLTGNRVLPASGNGSAIASSSPVKLVFVTVVGNPTSTATQAQVAGTGPAASLTTFGSVFSDAGPGDNCDIATTSLGFNFSDDASCDFTQPTDHTSAGSPLLGPLADNGGPTMTLLPAANSPLVDTIPRSECPVPVDQRGDHRPHRALCDIGAVER